MFIAVPRITPPTSELRRATPPRQDSPPPSNAANVAEARELRSSPPLIHADKRPTLKRIFLPPEILARVVEGNFENVSQDLRNVALVSKPLHAAAERKLRASNLIHSVRKAMECDPSSCASKLTAILDKFDHGKLHLPEDDKSEVYAAIARTMENVSGRDFPKLFDRVLTAAFDCRENGNREGVLALLYVATAQVLSDVSAENFLGMFDCALTAVSESREVEIREGILASLNAAMARTFTDAPTEDFDGLFDRVLSAAFECHDAEIRGGILASLSAALFGNFNEARQQKLAAMFDPQTGLQDMKAKSEVMRSLCSYLREHPLTDKTIERIQILEALAHDQTTPAARDALLAELAGVLPSAADNPIDYLTLTRWLRSILANIEDPDRLTEATRRLAATASVQIHPTHGPDVFREIMSLVRIRSELTFVERESDKAFRETIDALLPWTRLRGMERTAWMSLQPFAAGIRSEKQRVLASISLTNALVHLPRPAQNDLMFHRLSAVASTLQDATLKADLLCSLATSPVRRRLPSRAGQQLISRIGDLASELPPDQQERVREALGAATPTPGAA